jgi:colanic acid biosynthesis glycosyl transferase WcaI
MGRRILVFSHVYPPDPAAVGQQLGDAAAELARRGHSVVVYTSARGYDDPSVTYPLRESRAGVEIRRLAGTSFGKGSLLRRLAGALSFMVQSFWIIMTRRGVAGVVFTTTPPLVGVAVVLAARLRRIPTVYWLMDLNPDQLIALGALQDRSVTARLLRAAARYPLRHTTRVIALDRFMADRVVAQASLRRPPAVIPPWAHEREIGARRNGAHEFREHHGLTNRFVIMYSGNHSASNPLTTLLQAAVRLRDNHRLAFVFAGGGRGKQEVERFRSEYALDNVILLPYHPIEVLGSLLAAADVHVVSLGDPMVGIIHPCKIYGAMAAARPVLYFGPAPSHITEMLDRHGFGWSVPHGDVDAAVATIREVAGLPAAALAARGEQARFVLRAEYEQDKLCRRFSEEVESAFRLRPANHAMSAGGLLPAPNVMRS